MNNSVVIKGNKYGIMVMLDEKMPFSELKEAVGTKFKESGKFFKKASMGISFEGRTLTDAQIRELIDVISENSEIQIVCVVDNDKTKEEVFRQAVEQSQMMAPPIDEGTFQNYNGNEGQFYRGTLRSGQVLESESSIVILGDVNPGAKVVSAGNVVILGALKGTVYAGVTGNASSVVVALEMAPMQIRIGDIIARSSDTQGISKKKKAKPETKIAFVENDNIYIEPLNKEVLNDIRFN
jgi:septum site-determining protein MinC